MRHSFSILGTFIVFFSFQVSFAQTPTWKNITPPGWSGTFTQIEFVAGNKVIATANNGWIYSSLDTGKTWEPYYHTTKSEFNVLSFEKTSKLRGILASDSVQEFTSDGFNAYTQDGGATWHAITGSMTHYRIKAVYWKTVDTVLSAAWSLNNGTRIFKSTDGGQTWAMMTGQLDPNSSDDNWQFRGFHFTTASHGFMLTDGHYAETLDGGTTWTYQTFATTGYQAICNFSNGKSLVMASTIDINSKSTFPGTQFNALSNAVTKITDAGSGHVFAVVGYQQANAIYYYSIDSGISWKSKNILSEEELFSCTFLNQKIGLVAGNYLSSYCTIDSGKTWTRYVYGAAEGFNKIYCKTAKECYITGSTGRLFHTKDGGTTWDYQDLFKTSLQQVVFPTPDTGYVSANGAIFRTTDTTANGERIWTRFTQTNSGGFLSFPTKDTGYVGFPNGGGTVDKTTDAGQTWNTAADYTFVTNVGIYGSTACFRSTTEGLVSGSNGNLLYTNNGGTSWQVKANGIVASAIIAVNDNWLVVNNQNVYLCDKDINCTLKHSINSQYIIGIPVKRDSNTIYLSQAYKYNHTTDSVLISNDGGNTWKSTQDSLCRWWMSSFGDRNTVYSLLNGIYRGNFKSQTSSSIFTQTDKQTLTCTITDDANTNYTATILLVTNTSDTITVSQNIVITNGIPVLINMPNSLQTGTTFKIVIQPTDTTAFSTVQSQTFTITDAPIVEENKIPAIKVIGNTIICNCQTPYETYNTLGQRMQNNTELPVGIYVVRCGSITQKILIKQ